MGLFLMAVAAWVIFLAVASALIAFAYPLLRRPMEALHPGLRANLLRLVAVAPAGLATLGVALCFAPKLFGSALSRADHCFDHADAHPHFCLNHPPHIALSAEAWAAVALIGLALLGFALLRVARLRQSARILRQLAATARFDEARGAWMIDSELPVAISVGFLRTRTMLSSGLLQVVPERLVDAIVAHEHAHERRRDGLWKLATEVLSVGHLPGTRRAVIADLELACEQACDEEAGIRLGDRTRVAEALVAMERVRQGMTGLGPAVHAFGARGITARVESLVSPSPGRNWDRRAILALLIVFATTAAAAADPLHHLTETLLHHVLG